MAARSFLLAVICACGSRPPPATRPAGPERIAIIASERGPQGARLVAIDEHGDRRFVIVKPAAGLVRDTNPTVSPDGAWVVFASSRGRSLDTTSLWIAALGVEAPPVRLTEGDWIDAHPVWTRDGRAIVFASTRDGGDFDLWRLPIAGGAAAGAPEQITHGEGHEVTPTVAADGTIIYAAVTPTGGNEIVSRLEARAPDGTIRTLTTGPADSAPALSPDGKTLAFARPQLHGNKLDSELWRMPIDSEAAAPILDLPMTEESGPVWSRDGRFLFATSVLRGEDTSVVFSSIVHIDLREVAPRARILEDRAGAIVRLTPAIATGALDAAALDANPEYLPELARIMQHLIEQQIQGRSETP